LSSGSYDIDVRDENGCPLTLATQTVVINPELTVTASAPNISVCDTDADITITANGGDGNYTFAVVASGATPLDTDFNTTNPVLGFIAGNYDVYVRDNDGNPDFCSDSFPLTITQDAPINFTPTPTDVTCFGGADGAISVVLNSGGQAPFMYSIDNGVTYRNGTNFPNLIAGTYPVVVRDANLCVSPAIDVVINQPNQLASITAFNNLDCNGDNSGNITINASNYGAGGFQYNVNGGTFVGPFTSAQLITGLNAQIHNIVVQDVNDPTSCTIPLSQVLTEPAVVEVNATIT
ncbi:unnamed protein product, partial [Ectocarpus sp. 12 AP-2014]